MGNTLGGKKATKIMKINGEIIRLKTPVQAGEVVKDYPGHVLLDSEAVKHFGVRARPMEPFQDLRPKRLYFLVELPKIDEDQKFTRRVRSGINMTAKDRLESLMLSRRSVSDLSIMKPRSIEIEEMKTGEGNRGILKTGDENRGMMRVKMRLPKAEVAKLMMESRDEAEAAERIVGFYLDNESADGGCGSGGGGALPKDGGGALVHHQQLHWKGGFKAREKRVGFLPVSEEEIQLAVSS